jgi:cell division protein FtsZ
MPKERKEEEIKKVKIGVIGIGGGGANIVSELSQKIKKGISFFVADTDAKTLRGVPRNVGKILLGREITGGFGTGMDPELAWKVAKKEKEKIKNLFLNQDLTVLVSCLGGGVGSGMSSIFSQVSKDLEILTLGIFTLPFDFEGIKKTEIAKNSLRRLRKKLNSICLIPNERIFRIVNKKTPLKKALSTLNEKLTENLKNLLEIIEKPGLINIDFADLETIFEGKGNLAFLNSIEVGLENNLDQTIRKIISCPLYPYGIKGAKRVILNISGPDSLTLNQVGLISKSISDLVSKDAKIIFGLSQKEKEQKIKILLLAVGCKSQKNNVLRKQKKNKKFKKTKAVVKKEAKQEIKKEIIRKNGLGVKNEIKKEEEEILAQEKFFEVPTFLRKKLIKS